jgi:hypothetical protein
VVLEKPPAKTVFQQEALETIKLHLHDVPFKDIEILRLIRRNCVKKQEKLFTLCCFVWSVVGCVFGELVLCVYRKLAAARWKP